MIQTTIAAIIGIIALLYVGKKISKQFSKVETDPKCDNCPVPEIKKTNKSKV